MREQDQRKLKAYKRSKNGNDDDEEWKDQEIKGRKGTKLSMEDLFGSKTGKIQQIESQKEMNKGIEGKNQP